MPLSDFAGKGARYMLNKELALTRALTNWTTKFLDKTHKKFIREVKSGKVKIGKASDSDGSQKELAKLFRDYHITVWKWNYSKANKGKVAFGPDLLKLIDRATYQGNKAALKRVGELRAAHYDAGRAYIASMRKWYLKNTGKRPTANDLVRELSGLTMRGGPPARFPNRPRFVFRGKPLKDLSGKRDPYKVSLRSRVWARTELTEARNEGALQGIENAGFEYKMWKSQSDNNVRSTHAKVHGQVVKVRDPFVWTGVNGKKVSAQKPGAVGLPAAERINCRCIVVAALPSEYKGKK